MSEKDSDDKTNQQAEILSKFEEPDTEDPNAEEVKEYLSIYAGKSAVKKEQAIELVKERTEFSKTVAREMLEELEEKQSLRGFSIESITKIQPINPDDETVYRFHVEVGGEEYEFKIGAADLVTSTEFKQRIFELTNRMLQFESWTDQLNQWMDEIEVEVREEEPLKDAHAVVEQIFKEFEMLQPADDRDEFKQFSDNMCLIKEDEEEVLVSGRWIDQQIESMNMDVGSQKVRALLDEYMPSGEAKKVRVSEADYFRAWRFNLERLTKIGVMETIRGDV